MGIQQAGLLDAARFLNAAKFLNAARIPNAGRLLDGVEVFNIARILSLDGLVAGSLKCRKYRMSLKLTRLTKVKSQKGNATPRNHWVLKTQPFKLYAKKKNVLGRKRLPLLALLPPRDPHDLLALFAPP